MYIFCLNIFLSAALLFQIQPIIAKFILPWFGGAANVWIVCLIFFQTFLLLGYLYAHLLSKIKTAYHQAVIHLGAVLITVVLVLPIKPDYDLLVNVSSDPQQSILFLLFIAIGLPYLLISSSGPLLQSWFQKKYPEKPVYRLYAISNTGSLSGLLSYPFLVEPFFTLDIQTYIWSFGFIIYSFFCFICIFLLKPLKLDVASKQINSEGIASNVSAFNIILWISLACLATTLLLATTNQITQEIPSIPLLWILPLSVYLISFIICFEKPKWYIRKVWIPALFLSLTFVIWILFFLRGSHFGIQIFAYSFALFVGCVVGHGELYRLRPHPKFLTLFYLFIAFGGVIGGVFVGLVAPKIFSGYWEIHIAWVLLLLAIGLCLFKKEISKNRLVDVAAKIGWSTVCAVFGVTLVLYIQFSKQNSLLQARSFYGVLQVKDKLIDESINSGESLRVLSHGLTVHGAQIVKNKKLIDQPTAYYTNESGIGIALASAHKRQSDVMKNVGVVGMGVATIASLCKECRAMTFFEIDPNIVEVAESHFSFLSSARDNDIEINIVIGDARVSLENALRYGNEYKFDVLAVDAFSSDSIPVHLLTKEAFELYFKHLDSKGILAVHLSNRNIDLVPIVSRIGKEFDKDILVVETRPKDKSVAYPSTWMLFSKEGLLKETSAINNCQKLKHENLGLWTDQYSNVLKVFLFSNLGKKSKNSKCLFH